MSESSHDIVSLLYSMKGMIETHLVRAEEGGFFRSEERLRHAEEVLKRSYSKADSVIQITKRLKTIAEPDSACGLLRVKTSVRFVWKKILRELREEFPGLGIEYVERIPEKFPVVLCNRSHFREILRQIARNGVQAMTGELTLERYSPKLIIRAEEALSRQENPCAIITLADTGPGISVDNLGNIFHPFFTSKPDGQGNGLGLYLVNRLVAKNQGQIKVSSYPGFGTTVTLEFPVFSRTSVFRQKGF